MEIGLTDSCITLTIKAPNQQIDDQIIKCKLDWSVAKLKGYIHETYPNKPKTEDQRLIYSGQLLTDSVILKDILRPYDEDGQLNRTVHLVCASSSCCISPKEKLKTEQNLNELRKCPKVDNVNCGASTSGNNMSSKNSNEASSSVSSNKQDNKTPKTNIKTKNNVKHVRLTPEQIGVQQILWVNKIYAMHMAKYWQSVASSLGTTTAQLNTQNNESPQDLPNNNNNNNQPTNQNNVQENNVANRNPRNARRHQDWLDYMYISSRVLIFISILYFYSSPGRFIVVTGFALIFYLYQSGILRHFHEQNRRRFEPAPPPQPPPQPQPQPEQQNVDDNRNSQEHNENTDDTAVRQNERVITTWWTLLSTFFTSLIPQQPDII